MSSPNDPVLCCPLPYRVAPVFVQVVSPPLGWSPLTSFLVIWSPSGDARGPSVVFEAVDMPCPGPFHFSQFCPLPNPDVGPSIFVCDVEHTSFHFGLCGRKFVLWLESGVIKFTRQNATYGHFATPTTAQIGRYLYPRHARTFSTETRMHRIYVRGEVMHAYKNIIIK